jgi:glucose-6-phosphate dehydrogenase assembly protein OpcA
LGVVADVERRLAQLRARETADGLADLRTSTMTHVVWAPPRWLERARAVFAALEERHPARTIFLVPERGRRTRIEAEASLKTLAADDLSREVFSEVVELRLAGTAVAHPGSVVLPLLIPDLPAFCRWRGEPPWETSTLAEIVHVVDRLIVHSAEWARPVEKYGRLAVLFDEVAVSDVAYSRTLPWRIRIAETWPAVKEVSRLHVEGPQADAALLAGWLRSRLGKEIALTRRAAPEVRAVRLDGELLEPPPGEPPSPGDLLSAELDVLGRDRIYEAAVHELAGRAG